MLSLNEMMITDGQSNGLLDESNEKETIDLMSTSINGLINEHRNSFLSSKNNFTMNNIASTDYLKRPKNHSRKHKNNRIMSNRHKAIKKVMKYNGISRFEASMFQKNQKKNLVM